MDELSQQEFNKLVNLSPEELTPEQRAFLFARRTYLTTDQKRIFEDTLVTEQTRVDVEAKAREEELHPKPVETKPVETKKA